MKMYKVCSIMLVLCSLFGCNLSTVNANNESLYPTVDEIDWVLKPYLSEGNTEHVSFDYMNNSDYTIASVEMKWQLKEDMQETLLTEFNTLQEDLELSDEEMTNLYIGVKNRKICEPGASVENSGCTFNSWRYVEPDYMGIFELMTPDAMTVSYLKDGEIYTVKYDYSNDLYMEGDSTLAYSWPEDGLGSKIPKLESSISEVILDMDTSFSINVYGITREEYEDYIEICKEAGFTEDFSYDSDNGVVVAKNIEGCMLIMDYVEEDSCVSIGLSAS